MMAVVVLFCVVIGAGGWALARAVFGIGEGFFQDFWYMSTSPGCYMFFIVLMAIIGAIMFFQYITRTGDFKEEPIFDELASDFRKGLDPKTIIKDNTEIWFSRCKHIVNQYKSLSHNMSLSDIVISESELELLTFNEEE